MAGREGRRTPSGVRGRFRVWQPQRHPCSVHYNTQALMVSRFFARRPDGLRNPHMESPFATEPFSPNGLVRERIGLSYPHTAGIIPRFYLKKCLLQKTNMRNLNFVTTYFLFSTVSGATTQTVFLRKSICEFYRRKSTFTYLLRADTCDTRRLFVP